MAKRNPTDAGPLLTALCFCLMTGMFLYQAQVVVRPSGVKLSRAGVPVAYGYGSGASSDPASSVPASSVPASSVAASSASAAVASSSRAAVCGNGVVETGEQCDPPGVGTCNNTCKNATTAGTGGGGGGTTTVRSSSRGSAASGQRLTPPANCGNGIVEPSKGEKCDNGIYNGLSPDCNRFCEDKYCGDGIVSPENNEECEPAKNADGSLVAPVCGKSCTIPSCDGSGCVGGCGWVFLAQCKAVTPAASSKPASSAAPLALPSSVSRSSLAPSSPAAVASSSKAPPPASSVKPAAQASSPAPVPAASSVTQAQPAASSVASEEPPVEEVAASSEAASEGLELPPAACGDGMVQEENGEACDDGNLDPGDGCDAACAVERGPRARCGDGIAQPWEQCDEGDRNADDVPDACRLTCRTAYCGDGVTDAGEQCDDGNDILGDGCTPTCVFSLCGNGVLELGEECDEGRRNDDSRPDACSTLCLMPRCGDGVTDPAFGEACDAGLSNVAEPDACRPWCAVPRCGDGIEDAAEQCDDGNLIDGDGCDASCAVEAAPASSAPPLVPLEPVHAAAPAGYPIWWWLLPLLLMLTTTAWAVTRYVRGKIR